MTFDEQTLELLKFGWGVLITLCSFAGAIVMLWASKNFVRRDEYDDAHEKNQRKLIEHSDRLTRIETELRQAPKHSDLVALSAHVSELRSQIAELKGQSKQTNHLLAAIHEHLLNSE